MEYPECEKLAAVAEDSHKLGEFWDWLIEHGVHLIRDAYPEEQAVMDRLAGKPEGYVEHLRKYAGTGQCHCSDCARYQPTEITNKEQLLAKYFDIDLDKVETERRALLDDIKLHGKEVNHGNRTGS